MDNGWIKIHRSILEWEWWDDVTVRNFFLYCLIRARHKKEEWKTHTIERGQLVGGMKILAKETDLSEKQIRRAITALKRSGNLAVKWTNKFSLITINNYDLYQQQGSQKGGQNGSQKGTPYISKEEKKERKKEDSGENSPPKPSPSEIFLQFVSDVRTKSEKYEKLVHELNMRTGLDDLKVRAELDKFVNYWTEKNQTGKKERWQMQPTFETQKRLTTWFSNITKYQEKSSKGAFIS